MDLYLKPLNVEEVPLVHQIELVIGYPIAAALVHPLWVYRPQQQ